jgi:hypothetical protein
LQQDINALVKKIKQVQDTGHVTLEDIGNR